MRHTGRVLALELSVVGLADEVPLGIPAYRGCKGRVVENLGPVRLEGGNRRGLQGDSPDALPGFAVHDHHCIVAVELDVADVKVQKFPDLGTGILLVV